MALTSASAELTRLRSEIDAEEARMLAAEQEVDTKATQLGYLHAEYTENIARITHFYAPKLEPQLRLIYAHQVQSELVRWQVNWLEKKVIYQEKCSQTSIFDERRDLRADALAWLKKVRQGVLRVYEQIETCPAPDLQTLSQYTCPPDVAIDTMALVMKLRGDHMTPGASTCWADAQVLLSFNYFTNFFVKRSEGILRTRDMLDMPLFDALEQFCCCVDHSVEQLYRCSTPIGILGEWLHAVRDYYRVKLITAPVLEDVFDERGTPLDKPASRPCPTVEEALCKTAELVANQFRFTLGESYIATKSESTNTAAGTVEGLDATSPLANSTAPDAKAEPNLDEDPEVRAALDEYQNTKSRLAHLTRPAEVDQRILYDLRHCYHQHQEAIRSAEEAMACVKKEMQERIDEVITNYDGTMVPIEEQLESKTREFLALISTSAENMAIEGGNSADAEFADGEAPENEASPE